MMRTQRRCIVSSECHPILAPVGSNSWEQRCSAHGPRDSQSLRTHTSMSDVKQLPATKPSSPIRHLMRGALSTCWGATARSAKEGTEAASRPLEAHRVQDTDKLIVVSPLLLLCLLRLSSVRRALSVWLACAAVELVGKTSAETAGLSSALLCSALLCCSASRPPSQPFLWLQRRTQQHSDTLTEL
jgi:hypothetical protein